MQNRISTKRMKRIKWMIEIKRMLLFYYILKNNNKRNYMPLLLYRSLMPSRNCCILFSDTCPIFSIKSVLLTVQICVILITLFFGKFASPLSRRTFPGAFALFRFDVNEQTTIVLILLVLNTLFWTTIWRCLAGIRAFWLAKINPVNFSLFNYHGSSIIFFFCLPFIDFAIFAYFSSGISS